MASLSRQGGELGVRCIILCLWRQGMGSELAVMVDERLHRLLMGSGRSAAMLVPPMFITVTFLTNTILELLRDAL